MNFYRWHAVDQEKIHLYGIEQSDSVKSVCQTLKGNNFSEIQVRKLPSMRRSSRQKKRWLLTFLNRWIALSDSGYDQLQAFSTMQRQSSYQQEAQALQYICNSIQAGLSVSVAMAKFPDLFPGPVRQQASIAEQTGQYSHILPLITASLEQQIQQQQALAQQLRYPLTVLVIAALLAIAMQLWVLPAFANVYAQMNIPLPALTETVLSFSGARGTRALLYFFVLVVLVTIISRWVLAHGFRHMLVCGVVYAVVPNLLARYRHLLRDLETLQNNLKAGIALAPACMLTSRYSPSKSWSMAWLQASIDISRGIPLHRSLGRHTLPSYLTDYIVTGELAGRLPEQLDLAINQLKACSEGQLQLVCKAIPGVMLSLVSVFALIILLAVYVPLFQLGAWVG